jgi:hypothetical protein
MTKKQISLYTPRDGRSYSAADVEHFLKRFQLHEALKLIGTISHDVFLKKEQADIVIRGVPLSDCVLAYLAMRLIESANDYRKYVMSTDDLLKAADMYWGLPDPIETEEGHSGESCLMRIVSNQFDYQRPLSNLLQRTFAIYRDIWPRFSNAVPARNAIERISGLDIEEILVMCFSFTNRASKGFFRLYPENLTTDRRISHIFTQEKQQRFVDWISRGYKEFREQSKAELRKAPAPTYEKYRLNPLVKYPALRTDRNPKPGEPPVHLLPIPRLLMERVTRGLYFELSDHFMGAEKANPFRTSFGFVFQEYVGDLLKEAFGQASVLPELKYSRQNLDSTDWFVLRNDRCILVEAKQSSIYLNAKTWGGLEAIKEDLGKTVGKGVKQLWRTEQAISSNRFKEFSHLAHVKEFERLVVTYDRPYFTNSTLRSQVWEKFREDGVKVPEDYHWHLITIDELEDALGLRDVNFFDVLKAKRFDPTDDTADFREYLRDQYRDKYAPNPYLDRIYQEFFSRFE